MNVSSRQGVRRQSTNTLSHTPTRPRSTQGAPSSAVMRAILAASTAAVWLFVRSANPTGRPRSSGSTVCANRAHAFQPHVIRHWQRLRVRTPTSVFSAANFCCLLFLLFPDTQRQGESVHTPVRAARPCATCALAHRVCYRVSLCRFPAPRVVRHRPTAPFDRPRWAPTRPGAWRRVQRGPRTGPRTGPRMGRCCSPLRHPRHAHCGCFFFFEGCLAFFYSTARTHSGSCKVQNTHITMRVWSAY